MAELSVRYAVALFELAMESGKLNEYVSQSVVLRDALLTNQCRELLEHPSITDTQKKSFLQSVFGGQINQDLLGFLFLTIAKSRENIIIPALNRFIAMGNQQNRRVVAEIVTARPLSDVQAEALRTILSKKINKQIDLTLTIDPDIIGGLLIRVDGYLLDFTIKLQLQDMTNSIKRSWSNDLKTG